MLYTHLVTSTIFQLIVFRPKRPLPVVMIVVTLRDKPRPLRAAPPLLSPSWLLCVPFGAHSHSPFPAFLSLSLSSSPSPSLSPLSNKYSVRCVCPHVSQLLACRAAPRWETVPSRDSLASGPAASCSGPADKILPPVTLKTPFCIYNHIHLLSTQ